MRTSAKRLSWRSLASLFVVLALLGGWWLTLAPRAVGGPVSVVIVDGTSMQPKYHTGDVVILRRQSSYHLGEIAAVKVDGGQVIHQLVAGNAKDGWHTKGINRQTPDSWTIPNDQVLGTPWIFLPGAGRWTTYVHTAEGSGIVLGALFFLAMLMPGKRKRSIHNRTLGQAVKDAKRSARLTGGPGDGWKPRVPTRVDTPILSALVLLGIVAVVLATLWTFPRGPLSLSSVRPPHATLLALWAVVGVLTLACTALAGRVYLAWGGDEVDKAVARLREVLVPVAHIEMRGSVATVASVKELHRVAKLSVAPVLHAVDGARHTFAVLGGDATYVLTLGAPEEATPDEVETTRDHTGSCAPVTWSLTGIVLTGGPAHEAEFHHGLRLILE